MGTRAAGAGRISVGAEVGGRWTRPLPTLPGWVVGPPGPQSWTTKWQDVGTSCPPGYTAGPHCTPTPRLHSRSALHPSTLQIHAAPLPCHSIHGSYRDSHLTPDGGRQPWESPHPGPHSSSPRAHRRVPAAPRTHVCPWSRLRTAREWEELRCSDPGHRAAGGGVIK